jgi:hypothetical protein
MGKVKDKIEFSRRQRWLLFATVAALLLLAAPAAFSQSCALCYTQAASSGSKMIQALKSGILVLVIPPTLASIGLIFVVRRKSNQVRRTDDREDPGQDW